VKLKLMLLCAAASVSAYAQAVDPTAPRKIQTLIITGQDAHPWRETSPYIKDFLNETGRFEIRTTEEFRGSTLETLNFYDLAILVYSDEKLTIPKWSQATKDALLTFVSAGKGLVIYHHSAASFQDWPDFEKLSGCVWRTGQSHHSPVHDYKVEIRDFVHGEHRRVVRRFEVPATCKLPRSRHGMGRPLAVQAEGA
jgi:uncharacterized protein